MLGNEFRHLEHIDDILPAKDFFQAGISIDVALVFFVLEIMALDVSPEFFDDIRSGHRAAADYGRQILADVHRLHKRRIYLLRHGIY